MEAEKDEQTDSVGGSKKKKKNALSDILIYHTLILSFRLSVEITTLFLENICCH